MPLDPKAKGFLEQFAGMPALNELSVADARAGLIAMAGMNGAPEEIAVVESHRVPTAAVDVPVRVYRPAATKPLPVLVYFHGGGWTVGNLDTHDNVCRALARRTPCVVVSVDYRLAPDHKFPAAADDCYAATRWAAAEARALGGDPTRVCIGGDSAGGNLAAVVAQMARDRGGPRLCHQLLVYPVTDHRFDTASYRDNGDGYFLTRTMMEWFWNHYLATPADGASPLASPLRAAHLRDLPPALVLTAEFDPLRDEGEAYAAGLRDAGVPTQLTRYDGMLHGFFGMTAIFDQADTALDQAAGAIRAACA